MYCEINGRIFGFSVLWGEDVCSDTKMENGCFQRDESVRHNSETIDVNRTKGVSYERVRNYVDFATSGWPHSQLLGKLEDEES